ncbi:DUF1620-domain-containing protein [Dissoconium aciculare CBS 342.82]|uniref:ER membrane protein complex subunit 1 n=1 Tax=Dissoconium aciculare CBS 342.82 TaxID=1314786 RepID=A0A6J3M642_9PEZI|nr:DUF1620-domain-containing protein [Dissoconium aciculare CBS 342.82]KAF1822327.1 DUF1620-domain-containing protein [Dissoconium aciculare CBS 342.82]
MLNTLCLLIALLSSPIWAIFADEAWHTDYHFALLGLPQVGTTFFHQPNAASKASLIYTLSEQGVVGAVNPRDGSLVWRQVLQSQAFNANVSFLRAGQDQDIVVSGHDNQVIAWSAGDGRLVWDTTLAGHLVDLEILELVDGDGSAATKDVILLTGGGNSVVQRIDGSTGAARWSFDIGNGDLPYQISASATEIYAILLHKTLLGNYKIKTITLDSTSGRKIDENVLTADGDLASADTIITVGANSASPIIAWTDASRSTLKLNIIGTKTVTSFPIDTQGDGAVERVQVHAPYHTNSLPHFLVQYETEKAHWAEVFHVNLQKKIIKKAYQLPRISGKGVFSTSTSDANVYFTRLTQGEIVTVSSASHGVLGKWPIRGFGTSGKDHEHNLPVLVSSEISLKDNTVSAIRSAVLLASGEWVLMRDGNPIWQRPEALAGTITATFALPSSVQNLAEAFQVEIHSNPVSAYLHRVKRHILDLQKVPELLAGLPQRIASGVLGTTADDALIGDTFGFHQIIACAVRGGRVVAIDAGNPNIILWSKQIVEPSLVNDWKPVFQNSAPGYLTLKPNNSTQAIHVNATTGLPLSSLPPLHEDEIHSGSIKFSLQDGSLEAIRSDGASSDSLWRFVIPAEQRVLSIVPRPVIDPVASIGKVLGDRTVLYKYLSPNLALLITANDVVSSASFNVLDTASGASLFSSVHNDVDLTLPIASIMSENWFAYSYTSNSYPDSPKGHQLVVGELFESLSPNDRGPLGSQSNFSSLETAVSPYVLSKTYQIPESISKLSVTRTRQGITSRQLLAVLADSAAIVGIPYQILDPRRPVARDPTKNEQAEGLIRYAPVIEFDPKWYLNHKREVIGTINVITSPALIESTSLVFAYGLDIFGTKLSPSFSFDILGRDFNKFQMLATVAALAILTFVVGPLQVNTRWQFR